jgi:hypothetical protein
MGICFVFFYIVSFVVPLPLRLCFLLYFSEVAPPLNVLSFLVVIIDSYLFYHQFPKLIILLFIKKLPKT